MGLTFRDGNYAQRVWFGKRKIKAGEAAAIWDMNGAHRVVVGPRLKRLFFSDIRFLNKFVATKGQYLRVEHTNGKREHIRGPCTMFLDPLQHQAVHVKDAFFLSGPFEHLVVHSPIAVAQVASGKGDAVESGAAGATSPALTRQIVTGPIEYYPGVDEQVHRFQWSGVSDFRVLQTRQKWDCSGKLAMADNLDATLHLTVCWNVPDVLAMLDCTSDPLSNMNAALAQDLSRFGATLNPADLGAISQLVSDGKLPLNALRERARAVGAEVVSVTFRSLEPGAVLAHRFEKQRELEAKLAAETAAARQANELAANDVQAREERAAAERALAASEQEHSLSLDARAHEAALQRRRELD